MGKSAKPSIERHRGYRTRDRPPARQARRNGCCHRQAHAARHRCSTFPVHEKTRGAGRCRFRSWMPAPRSTPCISASDRPSASTVGCCWRSCAWCCRLSRCACSLASAGNVCWAKPNHGFFHCQQPVAIFLRACRRGVPVDMHRCASDALHRRIGCNRNDDASMRCMQAMARLAAHVVATRTASPHACAHARNASACALANDAARARSDERPAAISRRTSPFARKLRRIFPRHAPGDAACARFADAGNEEPATSPSRVPGRSMSTRISGLRLPATRRRHPARAGR